MDPAEAAALETTDSAAAPSGRPRRPKRRRHLRVPVNEAEAAAIEAQAEAAGLSIAAYLRNVGLGYAPRPVVDHDRVQELLRINGDLGRLGGLLKLWLSDDAKLREFPRGQVETAVRSALRQIEKSQVELRSIARRALRRSAA